MISATHRHLTNRSVDEEGPVSDGTPLSVTPPEKLEHEEIEKSGHHSLPTPLEIRALHRSTPSDSERGTCMQTIASVAGNVLEW